MQPGMLHRLTLPAKPTDDCSGATAARHFDNIHVHRHVDYHDQKGQTGGMAQAAD
jgi:hypothetical protein